MKDLGGLMIDRRRGQGIPTWRLGAGIALAVVGAALGAHAQTPPAATAPAAAPPAPQAPAPVTRKAPPAAVTFYGSPTSPIAGGVVIPAGAAWVWTSGTGPPVVNKEAAATDIARYGDTKTQARGVLKSIETQLAAQGLTMADVVYLRCYLVADPAKGGLDVDGWNAAYREFFGTAANPTKPARATLGVAAMVVPLWLVEIEAVAVYPAAKP
jgi:enamine deaminase RidA (YjgF/YER057c/UK114 family)